MCQKQRAILVDSFRLHLTVLPKTANLQICYRHSRQRNVCNKQEFFTFLGLFVGYLTALYGSETWTVGKNEERIINSFETWCCRRMLKIKWTDRITNDEAFQRAKEERLRLKIFKNRRHSWTGHTIRHNEFVVNILEGAIIGKKAVGRPRLEYISKLPETQELTVIQQ